MPINPTYKKGFFTLSPSTESYLGDLKADGTVPLTANWDVGAFTITAKSFTSDVANGTAPFTSTSTTVCTNLNADLLDGVEGSAYSPVAGSSSIVTVGTIATGAWHGTVIDADHGGTGNTVYVIGDVLAASTTTALSRVAAVAAGQVFCSAGTGTLPAWSGNPSVASLVLTGTGTFASTAGAVSLTTTIAAEDAPETAFTIAYTTDKTAAQNDTGLKIVQTDTASGGTSYLQEWYTGSTQVAYITNAGAFQCDGNITTGGELHLATNEYLERAENQLGLKAANKINFTYTSDLADGNPFSFLSGTNIEMTDTDAQQVFLSLIPKVNQTLTAGYEAIRVNVTETGLGSGINRIFSGQIGSVEKWGVDNRGGMMVGLTPDAVMQVGMVAMADAGTDERYDVNGAGGTLPIGIVGGSGPTVAGTARALVVQGTCYVAPAEDVIAVTRGHVCFVDASDAGYVDDNAALQAAGLNIGSYITSEAAIAFNGADDVDPTGNTIVLDSTPTWVVGDPVIFWDSGDTAPTGMTTGGVYWIKTIATATVTLSATRGGATLDITGDGSGTTMYLMRLPKVILHWQ